MSDTKVTMTDVERETLDYVTQHRDSYLSSGGRQGHVVDYRQLGGLVDWQNNIEWWLR